MCQTFTEISKKMGSGIFDRFWLLYIKICWFNIYDLPSYKCIQNIFLASKLYNHNQTYMNTLQLETLSDKYVVDI